MSAITRSWLAFAAIGAGLIHVALVIGSPLPLGLALAVLGLAEFGWGVLCFARETPPLPRLALVVALVPVVAWALLLVVSTALENPGIAASLRLLPLAVATLFELVAAYILARHLRRNAHTTTEPGVARYLLGLTAGALLVGGLTTPALAATPAGEAAQPHGSHTEEPFVLNLPNHDGGH